MFPSDVPTVRVQPVGKQEAGVIDVPVPVAAGTPASEFGSPLARTV